MEALPILRGLSAVLACLFGVGLALRRRAGRRAGALGASRVLRPDGCRDGPVGEAALLWRARSGVPLLLSPCRWLLRFQGFRLVAGYVAERFRAKGVAVSDDAALSWAFAAALGVAAVTFLLTGSVPASMAVLGCAGVCAFQGAKAKEESRRDSLRESVPEALQSLAGCFQSGLTVAQAFERQARELPGALGALFGEASSRMQLGSGVHGALEHLRRRADLPELSFVAVALDIQHQTGGSMRAILESSSAALEEQLELKRSLRVQTAQARLSARVVTVLPFVLIALFSLVSVGFLDPFFASVPGLALLAVALGLQVAGICCIRRMLAVDLT